MRLTPDELFEREYGADALAEQRRRFEEERRCTCGAPEPDKWGRRRGEHQSGCPRAGRKF